jgi:serine/threonine protein kinase
MDGDMKQHNPTNEQTQDASCPDTGTTPVREWKNGQTILDYHVVEDFIGRGGVGTVYRIRRTFDNRLFAVKTLTSTIQEKVKRQAFLQELQTWIDLPPYPHIVTFCFFRTINGQIAIFSEFVDGGSLADWISRPESRQLDFILDVGIQSAWALQTAHEALVVHQDVKPPNLLLTRDGILKITDFGLSRACYEGGMEWDQNTDSQPLLVTNRGMTIAYCSPEQAEGKKLDFRTDMWSWAVSILELFIGRLNWRYGMLAPNTLNEWVQSDPDESGIEIPSRVIPVLQRCFHQDPNARWNSMSEIADQLIAAWEYHLEKPYPRERPADPVNRQQGKTIPINRTAADNMWDDPHQWVERRQIPALTDGIELSSGQKARSLKSLAIMDLELFEEIQRHSEQNMSNLSRDTIDIAKIQLNIGFIHGYLGDLPGALGCFNRAIHLIENILTIHDPDEYYYTRSLMYRSKARILKRMNKYQDALIFLEKSIHAALLSHHPERNLLLAQAHLNRAILTCESGSYNASIEHFDQAIQLFHQLFEIDHSEKHFHAYLIARSNKAVLLKNLGKPDDAITMYRESIDVVENLLKDQSDLTLKYHLAICCINLANALHEKKQFNEAMPLYNKATILLEEYVIRFERREVADVLVKCYLNQAIAHDKIDDCDHAVQIYDRAIEFLGSMINRYGKVELLEYLAVTHMKKAQISLRQNICETAITQFDSAIELFERLIKKDTTLKIHSRLAESVAGKAVTLKKLGQTAASRKLASEVHVILKDIENNTLDQESLDTVHAMLAELDSTDT